MCYIYCTKLFFKEGCMEKGKCDIGVIEHPVGIVQGCKVCGQIIVEGKFAIGIRIEEGGVDYKYLLGAPPQKHCGEEKHFIWTSFSKEEAEKEAAKVLLHLTEKETTDGLVLMKFVNPTVN